MRYGSPCNPDEDKKCLIDGCNQSIAPEIPSDSEGSFVSSVGFSISNATSFSDFYYFKEPRMEQTTSEKEPRTPYLS